MDDYWKEYHIVEINGVRVTVETCKDEWDLNDVDVALKTVNRKIRTVVFDKMSTKQKEIFAQMYWERNFVD